jgi:hypothetical protein
VSDVGGPECVREKHMSYVSPEEDGKHECRG